VVAAGEAATHQRVSNREHLKQFHKCCSHRPVAGPGPGVVLTSCEDSPRGRGYGDRVLSGFRRRRVCSAVAAVALAAGNADYRPKQL
jgi:hypothetical protein